MSSQRSILVFLGLTLGLSWPLGAWIASRGAVFGSPSLDLFAFIPGLVGITLALGSGRGLGDIGFRRASRTAFCLALLVPSLAGALTVAALVASGADRWYGLEGVTPTAVAAALGVFFLNALGEEPGWRGFLLSRYREVGAKNRWPLTGVLWAASRYPLVLGSAFLTTPHWFVAIFFTVTLTAFGTFLAWLRETSQSIWPPILAHAIHGVWCLFIVRQVVVPGPKHDYFAGEAGIFLAAIYVGMAMPLVWGHSQRSGPRSA